MARVKPLKKEKHIVYENKYSHIYAQEVDFGSFTKKYFVLNCGNRAGLLVLREGAVLLVRQYRFLIDGLSWEIPGGKVDESETPQESAQRECFEETGILCRDLKPLLYCQETLDTISSPIYLFYARDFEDSQNFIPDPREIESLHWVPFEKCLRMVRVGEIDDSFTVLALMAYKIFESEDRRTSHNPKGKEEYAH
jgi:ADP-ribose pyrophosphatase